LCSSSKSSYVSKCPEGTRQRKDLWVLFLYLCSEVRVHIFVKCLSVCIDFKLFSCIGSDLDPGD
jgi:hypothetical protein